MSGLFDDVPDPEPNRVLVWFSCGVTSAVAARLTLLEYPKAHICRMVIASEHADNDRFAADVAKWLSKSITELRGRYIDHFQVVEERRYINGPSGALCTTELKRKLREKFQRGGDLHIFGFDASETERVSDFRENNPSLWFKAPLVDAGLTKNDAKNILERAGIELPAMYRLGYSNNNCIGCVKGGMGYWNRIRLDFPEVFGRMAKAERTIGATVLRRKGLPLYLDELQPDVGNFKEDQPGECGALCQAALERCGL